MYWSFLTGSPLRSNGGTQRRVRESGCQLGRLELSRNLLWSDAMASCHSSGKVCVLFREGLISEAVLFQGLHSRYIMTSCYLFSQTSVFIWCAFDCFKVEEILFSKLELTWRVQSLPVLSQPSGHVIPLLFFIINSSSSIVFCLNLKKNLCSTKR